jgi:antitoxin component of MazEF toxin-antitoxin module
MTQTAVKIGNSVGMIIPVDYREAMGISLGTKLDTEMSPDGKTMLVSRVGQAARVSKVTPEFLGWLEGFNQEYGPALKKLAEK